MADPKQDTFAGLHAKLDRLIMFLGRLERKMDSEKDPNSSSTSNPARNEVCNSGNLQSARMGKIDFWYFDGEDVDGWISRCNQMFEIEDVLENHKIPLASSFLEGYALRWHKRFSRDHFRRDRLTWKDYCYYLVERFEKHSDYSEELKILKQEDDAVSDSFPAHHEEESFGNHNPLPETVSGTEEKGTIDKGDDWPKEEETECLSKTEVSSYEPHHLEHAVMVGFDSLKAKLEQPTEVTNSMRSIFTFSTTYEFWNLLNNVFRPNMSGIDADFHCFKHRFELKWEFLEFNEEQAKKGSFGIWNKENVASDASIQSWSLICVGRPSGFDGKSSVDASCCRAMEGVVKLDVISTQWQNGSNWRVYLKAEFLAKHYHQHTMYIPQPTWVH